GDTSGVSLNMAGDLSRVAVGFSGVCPPACGACNVVLDFYISGSCLPVRRSFSDCNYYPGVYKSKASVAAFVISALKNP
ncbi:MAG: hypothetical protein Q8K65_00350, partial [Alphaproteobacteria bacterium]|nr:hypothetical protein [Alphaproteobacteria bacterium]